MSVIDVKNLTIGYAHKTIVKDISFSVGEGELVGIIGANGAGKSTLLKTMRGILPKKNGDVFLYDKNVTEMTEKEFAWKVAYLQQHVEVPFDYTGKEIVIAGRYPYLKWWESENEEDKKIVSLCMQYTGVEEFAEKAVTQLSGGQWQRVLLAKVLAQKTPVLFLDEPTTGLDIVYQEEMFRFCKMLAEAGKTVLMVVHELSYAYKFCSRIILVGNEKIIADGKPEDVISEANLQEAYKVALKIVKHKENGSIEICVKDSAEELVKKEELLKKICS